MSEDDVNGERALLRKILMDEGGYTSIERQPERGSAWLVVDMSTRITLDEAALIERIFAEDADA